MLNPAEVAGTVGAILGMALMLIGIWKKKWIIFCIAVVLSLMASTFSGILAEPLVALIGWILMMSCLFFPKKMIFSYIGFIILLIGLGLMIIECSNATDLKIQKMSNLEMLNLISLLGSLLMMIGLVVLILSVTKKKLVLCWVGLAIVLIGSTINIGAKMKIKNVPTQPTTSSTPSGAFFYFRLPSMISAATLAGTSS